MTAIRDETDIVTRLRQAAEASYAEEMGLRQEHCTKAADEIERLRKGIQDFLDGDYEPKVKKIDKCPHGQYGYEACEACIEAHFRRVLGALEQKAPETK